MGAVWTFFRVLGRSLADLTPILSVTVATGLSFLVLRFDPFASWRVVEAQVASFRIEEDAEFGFRKAIVEWKLRGSTELLGETILEYFENDLVPPSVIYQPGTFHTSLWAPVSGGRSSVLRLEEAAVCLFVLLFAAAISLVCFVSLLLGGELRENFALWKMLISGRIEEVDLKLQVAKNDPIAVRQKGGRVVYQMTGHFCVLALALALPRNVGIYLSRGWKQEQCTFEAGQCKAPDEVGGSPERCEVLYSLTRDSEKFMFTAYQPLLAVIRDENVPEFLRLTSSIAPGSQIRCWLSESPLKAKLSPEKGEA